MWLIASVVLRHRTATSPASTDRPPNRSTASRAVSYASVARWLFHPAPRCTDEYSGTNAVTASTTEGSAAVDAAASNEQATRSTPSMHGTQSSSPTRAMFGTSAIAGTVLLPRGRRGLCQHRRRPCRRGGDRRGGRAHPVIGVAHPVRDARLHGRREVREPAVRRVVQGA